MPRCRARGRFGSRDLSLVSFLSLLLSLLPLGLWSSAGDWVSGLTEAPQEQGGPAPAAGMGRGAEKERGRKRDGRRDREPCTPALVELVSSPALRGRKRERYCQLGPVLRCSSPGDGGPGTSEANSEHRQISLAGALLPGPALPASHCSHSGPRKSLRGRILCAAALQQHPWPPRILCPLVPGNTLPIAQCPLGGRWPPGSSSVLGGE